MMDRRLRACAFAALAALGSVAVPPDLGAQTLRLAEGTVERALGVPLNRAVVVESDVPFAEVSVANPEIADIATLSERSVYVLGRAPGRTTLTLLGADGALLANVEVRVTPDIAEFRERLRALLPGEPIDVRTANDALVLSGTVSSARRLDMAMALAERYAPDAVLNLMVVGGVQQVQLRVTFAEVARSVTKDFGGGIAFGESAFLGGDVVVGGQSAVGVPDLPTRDGIFSIDFPNGLAVGATLAALETKGLARTLAEPNIAALSGQPARFLAGGEVPIPTFASSDDDDGNRIGVEYRPFGVELVFTPTVVDGDVINLQLDASVSSIDNVDGLSVQGTVVPSFSTRQATTTVEIRDGQAFMIGGLLEDEFRDNSTGTPWLSELPVIGALFRSTDYAREKSELLIVISAHLVTPTAPGVIGLPTDGVVLPTEADLFLRNRISSEPLTAARSGRDGAATADDLSGAFGYVLE